jgi:hypothetical protein
MGDDERRSSIRYEPGGSLVSIGWYGPAGFQVTQGRVLNLSVDGVAVAATGLPTDVQAAWIRLAGAEEVRSEWVFGDVMEICESGCVEQWFRLKFAGSCPFDFFKNVVLVPTRRTETRGEPEPSGSRQSGEPAPSVGPVAERLAHASMHASQREAAAVVEETALQASHLRTALIARRSACGGSLGAS